MVVCSLVPRFQLLAALGERRALLSEPSALAPEPGRGQFLGEVSAAAEAFGVTPGMRVGEALSRCPALRLVAPDPQGAREQWSAALDALEGIGAEVESDLPGTVFFAASGLTGIHGGNLDGVLRAAGAAVPRARLGAAPSRFASYAAALHARPRRRADQRIVGVEAAAGFLGPLPVGLLRSRPELAWLPDMLERLGIRTLAALAALPAARVAERFGHPGLLAHELARGGDTPLDPRRPQEPVIERLALPDAASGPQLERALELLVGRVLARPERRGRTVRALGLSARFVAGGTWRERATLRQASADAGRIRLVLAPRLAALPAPAELLGLEVEAFGPPAHDQGKLLEDRHAGRRARLAEAVSQACQVAGPGAAMRVLDVDPGSRVPERRSVLAPYEAER
ncbi:MAG TPA: hypothetical protein VNT32_09005 [Thermoleophilaceae bacterium]|nr:hypothetical protein [Thermoleophilaceae bacterium]